MIPVIRSGADCIGASGRDVVQRVHVVIRADYQVLSCASEGKRLISLDVLSLAMSVDLLEPHRQAAVVTVALLPLLGL